MPPQALFGVSVALSFIAWGIVAMRYIWPELRSQSRADALRPLLILHSGSLAWRSWCPALSGRTCHLLSHAQLRTVVSLPRFWPCLH